MSRSPFWIDNEAFASAFLKAGISPTAPTAEPARATAFGRPQFSPPAAPRIPVQAPSAEVALPSPPPPPTRSETVRPEPAPPIAESSNAESSSVESSTEAESTETVEVPRLTREQLAENLKKLEEQEQDIPEIDEETVPEPATEESTSGPQEAETKEAEAQETGATESPDEKNTAESTQGDASADPNDSAEAEEDFAARFENLDDHLQVRLAAFLDWVVERTGAEGVFVIDDEGLVILERETDPDWVALSSYLRNFYRKVRRSLDLIHSGSLMIDLQSGGLLHWLHVDTQLGPHVLGIYLRRPISRKLTKSFQTNLAFILRQAPH